MDGVQLLQDLSHFEEAVYFVALSSQKFLVLILSASEGWKAESTLGRPSGFNHETPGLGIQCLNHKAIEFNPSLPKCWIKKENNTVGFNIKLMFFFTYNFRSFPDFV